MRSARWSKLNAVFFGASTDTPQEGRQRAWVAGHERFEIGDWTFV